MFIKVLLLFSAILFCVFFKTKRKKSTSSRVLRFFSHFFLSFFPLHVSFFFPSFCQFYRSILLTQQHLCVIVLLWLCSVCFSLVILRGDWWGWKLLKVYFSIFVFIFFFKSFFVCCRESLVSDTLTFLNSPSSWPFDLDVCSPICQFLVHQMRKCDFFCLIFYKV